MKAVSVLTGKKILILGGTGFLGANLVHYLIRSAKIDPAAIRVFFLSGTPTDALRDLPGLDMVPGNILNPEDVRRACEGVDYVFHLAASTSFDPGRRREQWLVNVEGTRHVLDAVRRSPSFKKMCYAGTVNVLGVPRPRGSTGRIENSSPYGSRPRLHSFRSAAEALAFAERVRRDPDRAWERRIRLGYFDSKLAAQELVRSYVERFGLNVVSVLPGTAFGPYDFLVGNGLYLLRIYQRRMPGVLKGGISAVHALDAVEGFLLAMERGTPGSLYIITGRAEDNLRFKEIMRIMAEVLQEQFPDMKIRAPSFIFPTWLANLAAFFSEKMAALRHRPCLLSRAAVKAGSQPLFYSYEQAARDLSYQPQRTFRQGVEDMAAYFRAEGLFRAKGGRRYP